MFDGLKKYSTLLSNLKNLIKRIKNILITPKTEWLVIELETATPISLLTSYVLPLVIISSIGTVLQGVLFAGLFGFKYFIILAVIKFVSAIIGFYLSIYVIDLLAPSFKSEKNLNRSAQLVAFSNTPVWIAGLLSFIPVLGVLASIAGWVYSIYLMYLGIGPMKKTGEDQKIIYMIVSFLIMMVIYFIIAAILGAIVFSIVGLGVATAVGSYRY